MLILSPCKVTYPLLGRSLTGEQFITNTLSVGKVLGVRNCLYGITGNRTRYNTRELFGDDPYSQYRRAFYHKHPLCPRTLGFEPQGPWTQRMFVIKCSPVLTVWVVPKKFARVVAGSIPCDSIQTVSDPKDLSDREGICDELLACERSTQ